MLILFLVDMPVAISQSIVLCIEWYTRLFATSAKYTKTLDWWLELIFREPEKVAAKGWVNQSLMYDTAIYILYKLFCCRHINEEIAKFRPCFVPKLNYFRSSTIMVLQYKWTFTYNSTFVRKARYILKTLKITDFLKIAYLNTRKENENET